MAMVGEEPTTREVILDAAEDCFALVGVRRTTIEDIAAAAGMSRITVYRRIGNRDKVVLTVLVRITRRYLQGIQPRLLAQATLADALALLVRSTVRAARRNELSLLFASEERGATGAPLAGAMAPLAESFGVQGRGSFYEETGAVRDVIQNHLFQVMTNLTMEPASALDGVAVALPALMRAEKLTKRAGRVGFDWPSAEPVLDKLQEEIAELEEAISAPVKDQTHIAEELGDMLFVVANLCRKLAVDPEEALRNANAKFVKRFSGMEELARARGQDFASLTLDEQEALWTEVKKIERGG